MTAVANDTTPETARKPLAERLRVTERVTQGRNLLAKAVSVVTGLCALVLVAGALMIALGANDANALVEFVKQTAAQLDFGGLRPGQRRLRVRGQERRHEERRGELGPGRSGLAGARQDRQRRHPQVVPPGALSHLRTSGPTGTGGPRHR